MQNEPRKVRRTANACVACRQSKIKCSGEEPCQNCQRRCLQCHFAEGGNKVVVSEKYLQDLQKQIEEHRRSPSASNLTPQDLQHTGYQVPLQPSPASLTRTQTPNLVQAQSQLSGQRQGQGQGQTQPQIMVDPQVENQYQSQREPSSAASVAHTHLSHSSYYSPPNLSQQGHSDNRFSPRLNFSPAAVGSKRTSEAAFSGNSIANSECRIDTVDTTLASPALTIDGAAQQPVVSTEPSGLLTLQPGNDRTLSVWPSALSIPSKIITNTQQNKRTWIWLAPWSTWSFTARLMLMLDEALHPGTPLLPPQLLETDSYDLKWKTASPSDMPSIHSLPSLDHAIYLLNTYRFYIGQPYRFFDEDEFEREIRHFYSNAAYRAAEHRLWFLKFLLILAYGTAFLARPTHSQEPPGAEFFKRAMALMPDNRALWKQSMLAIQVLALVGLYLFSIDEREAGHVYLGQAIRIAQMEGLHTQLPEEDLGSETVTRCRNLWWTLYIMDRHFSCSVGLPMSVKDSEITTKINPLNMGSQGDMARSLQVNLSHLLSVTLTTLYKPEKTPLGEFLDQTRSILHTLAHHAQEIEKIITLKFENSVETMPRDTTYITLMYHQCVIVATRPLLLSVLKERLDILGHPRDENWESFLAQTATVISTGIKSAIKTLEIMSSPYSVLEVFLPYELEFTFGAALHLVMANTLFPDDHGCSHLVHPILDDMIGRGKKVAEKRKRELIYLENICQELSARIQQEGLQILSLIVPEDTASEAERRRTMAVENEEQGHHIPLDADAMSAMNQPIHPHMGTNIDFLDNIGISSEDFLSIVQQIGDPDTLPEGVMTMD